MNIKNENPGMDELSIMLAAALPVENIIDGLKESILNYEIDPTEENFKVLSVNAFLLVQKDLIKQRGGDLEGGVKLSQEVSEIRSKLKIFEPNKN